MTTGTPGTAVKLRRERGTGSRFFPCLGTPQKYTHTAEKKLPVVVQSIECNLIMPIDHLLCIKAPTGHHPALVAAARAIVQEKGEHLCARRLPCCNLLLVVMGIVNASRTSSARRPCLAAFAYPLAAFAYQRATT